MLVIIPDNGGVAWAGFVTGWLNLLDIVTDWEGFAVNVMSALWHGVVVTKSVITVVSSGNDTSVLEPGPWGSDLSSIASE